MPALVAASGLTCAAYRPRQFYYAHHDDDRTPPPTVREVRALAFDYPDPLDTIDDELALQPISVSPVAYRERLTRFCERDGWDAFTDPVARDEPLASKDCCGVAHELVDAPDSEGDRSPVSAPSPVSPGESPERGAWEPQRVRAAALAKAPAWECEAPVPRALAEYPAVGAVRTVGLTTRNKAAYRWVSRAARDLDFAPSWLRDSTKCESCTYRERCSVETRLLSSLLGRQGRRSR